MKEARYIAIDEFAIRKGHKYMTVIMDPERRRIIYVREGRSRENLVPFFRRLKRHGVNLINLQPTLYQVCIIVMNHFSYIELRLIKNTFKKLVG